MKKGMSPGLWRVCLLLIMIASIGAAGTYAAAVPLFYSADEMAHFDYAYEIWHGNLPVFERGLVVHVPFGSHPPVQWTAQHPPLFYSILAPFVGPLVDSGHVVVAGYLARSVNVVISSALVLSIVWAVRQVIPTRPRVWLASGIISASCAWVIAVGGSVYNDQLAALFSALAVGLTARMIREGVNIRLGVLLALSAAGGALSRLSSLSVIALCMVVLSVFFVVFGKGRARWNGIVASFAAAFAVGASSGWFYLRNLRLTGSIVGGHSEWGAENLGRVARSFLDTATDRTTWLTLLSLFGFGSISQVAALLILLIPAGLAVLNLIARRLTGRFRLSREDFAIGLFLVACFTGVLVMQLKYAAGGGGLMPRYLFPVLVPIVALLSIGLIGFSSTSAVALPCWSVVVWMTYFYWLGGQSFESDASPHLESMQFPAVVLISVGAVATLILVGLVFRLPVKCESSAAR